MDLPNLQNQNSLIRMAPATESQRHATHPRDIYERRRREALEKCLGPEEAFSSEDGHPECGGGGGGGQMEEEVVVIGSNKNKTTQDAANSVQELNADNTTSATLIPAAVPAAMPYSSLTVQWLMNNYKTDRNGSIPRSTVYYHYIEHCKQHGLEPLNAASFGKLIRSVFLRIETRRLGTRGKSRYHYSGLVLKPTSTLKYIDVNELPSYYGHPSRTNINHTLNFNNIDFSLARNIPRNTYKERSSNYIRAPQRQFGRLKEVYAKKREEALKQYYELFENGEQMDEITIKDFKDENEEMEEQFVVLSSLCKNDLFVDTMSSLHPENFQAQETLVPLVRVSSTKRTSSNPMQFSSLTVQWLMDNFKTDKRGSIPRSAVYFHYMEHCNYHGLEPLNAASFGKLIRSVFLGIETRRLGTRGKSRYHYSGLVLKPTSTLKFVDLNDLPSYYGHPSGISAKESQNYHLNYTKNMTLIGGGESEPTPSTSAAMNI